MRNRKDTTVYPSPLGQGDAPTLLTRYRYSALEPLTVSGLKDWLVLDSETLLQVDGSQEAELQQTLRSYVVEPANAFLHGRPSQQRETLNGKTTTTNYEYDKPNSVLVGETVLETVETLTGFDHVAGTNEVIKKITREDSLVHGHPLLTRDDNNVRIRYTYDSLERVTSETVAPGEAEFEATRYYEYYLTSLDGQQAEQVVTDVKEVKTRTRFDGLNRPIYEERQNADSPLRAKDYRQTYAGFYDALGNLLKEVDYDWEDEAPVPLTSLFEYDAWGAQRCVTGPDGVTVYEETDPIGTREWRGPIQRSWRQGAGDNAMTSGVTVTWLNPFEKPARSMRFESLDPDEKPVSLHQYSYDGLGHATEEVDARDAKTLYSYDAFGRMLTNTLPGAAVVRRSYAEHSPEDLPTEISVNNIVLGKQFFDGLGRMTRSITQQLFRFDAMDNLTRVITTSTDGITTYTNQAIYTYDTTDPTQLSKVTNTGDATYPAEILLSYDEDGNLTRDEENRTLEYDALNRLISVSGLPGETPSGFDYDALDTLAGLNGGAEQRFYQNGALATRIQGAQRHTFMRGEGNLLAEQQEGAGPKSLLLASDNKNTVLREIGSDSANDIAYSAYGHRSAEQPGSTHLGYNGEFRETQTGCYLLGNGYRAYNPWLMRFYSPDSLSPFGEGGLNAYMYCGGDPISNVDPDGHAWYSVLWKRISAPFRGTPAPGAPKNMNTPKKNTSAAPPETEQTPEQRGKQRVGELTKKAYEANSAVMDQWTRKNQNPEKTRAAINARKKVQGERIEAEDQILRDARYARAKAVSDQRDQRFNPDGGIAVSGITPETPLREMIAPELRHEVARLRGVTF